MKTDIRLQSAEWGIDYIIRLTFAAGIGLFRYLAEN